MRHFENQSAVTTRFHLRAYPYASLAVFIARVNETRSLDHGRRTASIFIPAARTPAMPRFTFFEWKVTRRGQTLDHFPLFIIQLAPRSQAASATRALIIGIHNSLKRTLSCRTPGGFPSCVRSDRSQADLLFRNPAAARYQQTPRIRVTEQLMSGR